MPPVARPCVWTQST